MTIRSTAARKLLQKYVPVKGILEHVEAALEEADSDQKRRAISAVAAEALDAMGLDAKAYDNAIVALAALTDPRAKPEAPQVEVLDDEFKSTGRLVTAEQWATEDSEFARVLAAVNKAGSSAEAYQNLVEVSALNWEPTSANLIQLLIQDAVENDDGSIGPYVEEQRAEAEAAHWAEAAAIQEAEEARARKDRLFAAAFDKAIAEAEAAMTEKVEANAG